MNFYIPSYQDCVDIVDSNPDMYFYERKFIIDGYNISIFGYRYAKYNNFILPIIDKPNINALELKGITFVFDDNGEYKHYLLLPKFWEINQYNHCNYNKYKDKKIKNVTVKEDGFLISFLSLPNGKIISFTKKGFDSEINIESNKFLEDVNYKNFIKKCLDNNIQPIFEYVGNNMTVNYGNINDLILLKLRNNLTGEFVSINKTNLDGIKIITEVNKTLNELLDISNIVENCEGWVVHFEDDELLKVKTKWWEDNKNNK